MTLPAPLELSGPRAAAGRVGRALAGAVAVGNERIALSVIFCLAFAVRAFHVIREPFPLNDGGLFYVMARDLQDSNFVLPAYTSYNDGQIPFAYSPLSIYVAALADTLTPASLEDMFRVLPFLGALFAVWAFWRLALVLLPSRNAALVATLLFALVPRSFVWLIMGGGLPRGLALGLAMLAIREGYLLSREPFSWRRIAVLAGLSALTALTHLETAAFVALTFALFIAFRPRSIGRFAIAGLGALALTAPWLVAVTARHGFEPFIASTEYGGSAVGNGPFGVERVLFLLRNPVFTDEQFFPLVGALGVVGVFYALARREWLLPAWWVLVMIVGMRAFPTYAALPVTMLGGLVIAHGIAPSLGKFWPRTEAGGRPWALGAAALVLLVFLVNGALEHSRYDARFLRSMPDPDLAALQWVAEEVPAGEEFAVLPVNDWFADYTSEWFPALSGHTSVGTTQGYEWVSGQFEERLEVHESLRGCVGVDASCVASAMRRAAVTYVYVPSACCDALGISIRYSPRFDVLYYVDGALVAKLRPRS